MLQIRFAANRTIDEWQDAVRISSMAARSRDHQWRI
jgi:hypothetical protein